MKNERLKDIRNELFEARLELKKSIMAEDKEKIENIEKEIKVIRARCAKECAKIKEREIKK